MSDCRYIGYQKSPPPQKKPNQFPMVPKTKLMNSVSVATVELLFTFPTRRSRLGSLC